jgi:RimJ/RimL family protein N-acetyltransferase
MERVKPPAEPGAQVRLVGRFVRLRPVLRSDDRGLLDLATHEAVGYRWRLGGMLPTEREFEEILHTDHAPLQAVAERREGDQLVGHLSIYRLDHQNRTGYLSAAFSPQFWKTRSLAESTILFTRYAFATLNVRKIYVEYPAFNDQFARLISSLGADEVRIPDHYWYDGDHWDYLIGGFKREDFMTLLSSGPMSHFLGGGIDDD